MFPAWKGVILSGVSCLFDASTVLFVGFQALHEYAHVTMAQLFTGFAVATVVIHVASFY